MSSDPGLLRAFRLQCLRAIWPKSLNAPVRKENLGLVFLAWLGQEGADRDDLLDIVKEIGADPDPMRNCWPEAPRREPGDQVLTESGWLLA